jgi:hypothetical protein
VFGHFLGALSLKLSSEGLKVVAQQGVGETSELTDDVVRIGREYQIAADFGFFGPQGV